MAKSAHSNLCGTAHFQVADNMLPIVDSRVSDFCSIDENALLQELNEDTLRYLAVLCAFFSPGLALLLQDENRYLEEALEAVPDGFLQRQSECIRAYADHDCNPATLPERAGSFYYYTRQLSDEDIFPVYCRVYYPEMTGCEPSDGSNSTTSSRRSMFLTTLTNNPELEEQILNPNQFFDKSDYVHISTMKLSPDHRMLACTVDLIGNECYSGWVKDLQTGAQATLSSLSSVVSMEWGNGGIDADGRWNGLLYYTTPDDLRRPYQLWCVSVYSDAANTVLDEIGNKAESNTTINSADNSINTPSNSTLIYHEHDDAFFLDINRTKDDRFLTVSCNSKAASEVRVLDLRDAATKWMQCRNQPWMSEDTEQKYPLHPPLRLLCRREIGIQYFVDHGDDAFFIVTNAIGSPLKSTQCSASVDWESHRSHIAGEQESNNILQQVNEYQVITVPTESILEAEQNSTVHWHTLVPAHPDVSIEDMDLLQYHCCLYERYRGVQRIRIIPRQTLKPHKDDSPSAGLTAIVYPPLHELSKDNEYVPGSLNKVPNCQSEMECRGQVYCLTPGVNQHYGSRHLRFSVSSPVVPEAIFEVELPTVESTERHPPSASFETKVHLLQVTHAQNKFCDSHGETSDHKYSDDAQHHRTRKGPLASQFDSYRLHVRSCLASWQQNPDRPTASRYSEIDEDLYVSVVHRNDIQHQHPVLLVGYGAYGTCVDVSYQPDLVPLLDAGWTVAFAHVRGGGEMGRGWYHAGKLSEKPRSVSDFILCAESMVASGFCSEGMIAATGSSAGGLLVMAAAQSRPDLFGAVMAKVPFVDVINTMQDPTLPLTVHEYDEWGDPNADEYILACMEKYCPYNVLNDRAAASNPWSLSLPATFLTTSLQDARVPYWGPAKYIARVRQYQQKQYLVRANRPTREANADHRCLAFDFNAISDSPCSRGMALLKTSADDSHFGPVGPSDFFEDAAMEHAFYEIAFPGSVIDKSGELE